MPVILRKGKDILCILCGEYLSYLRSFLGDTVAVDATHR